MGILGNNKANFVLESHVLANTLSATNKLVKIFVFLV